MPSIYQACHKVFIFKAISQCSSTDKSVTKTLTSRVTNQKSDPSSL